MPEDGRGTIGTPEVGKGMMVGSTMLEGKVKLGSSDGMPPVDPTGTALEGESGATPPIELDNGTMNGPKSDELVGVGTPLSRVEVGFAGTTELGMPPVGTTGALVGATTGDGIPSVGLTDGSTLGIPIEDGNPTDGTTSDGLMGPEGITLGNAGEPEAGGTMISGRPAELPTDSLEPLEGVFDGVDVGVR